MREDEIITYIAHNLENPQLSHDDARAAAYLGRATQRARVVIVGGNEVSYGKQSDHPGGLRGGVAELQDRVDWTACISWASALSTSRSSCRSAMHLSGDALRAVLVLLEAMSMQATMGL